MLLPIRAQRGFTLIELMVVIAIISILASFTAPSFKRYIAKANLVEIQLFAGESISAINEEILVSSSFPSNSNSSSVLPDYSDINHIKSVSTSRSDSEQGSLTISLNQSVGITEGQYLKYTRASNGAWICETTLEGNIAPEQCAIAVEEEEE